MIRWVLLLVGIASCALGVVGFVMHPPIPEVPYTTSVAETVALFTDHDRVLVTVDGVAEIENRIYPSLVDQPGYTRRRPGDTYELPNPAIENAATIVPFIGAPVRYRGSAGPFSIALMGVEQRTLQDDVVRSERLLVPLEGTEGRLWAISPLHRHGDSPDGWLANTRFEGVLTRLADIGVNTATWTLEFSFDEISALAAENGFEISKDTLLIIEGSAEPKGDLFYLPVAGSDGALLITPFYESQPLPKWVESGPITGVMWVWDVEEDERLGLEGALGGPLPERHGIIHHDDSAVELNRKTKDGLKFFTGLGAVLLSLSAVFFAVNRSRE